MRNTVIDTITKAAEKEKSIFVVTGDAGFGVLDEFQKKFPERYLNLGVAEQNMISFSAGLAMAGYNVFVYNITPFVLYRCYEQVRNDLCYQKLPVTLIGIGSGVTYAPQGHTHYSVEDVGVARTLPGLVVLSPADPLEAELCAKYAIKSKKPAFIRLAKYGEPKIHSEKVKSVESPIVVKKGSGVTVLFHGSVGIEVMQAVEGLKARPQLISVPMLTEGDFSGLKKLLKNTRTVITVEEHYVQGGLGSIMAEWIIENGVDVKLRKLGVKNEYIHKIKNNLGMREHYGISASEIRRAITSEFKIVKKP
ncbi:MAG: transketolase [Nitrospinae bacterium]|nr:transketolase [Nitrospinota bacterium]